MIQSSNFPTFFWRPSLKPINSSAHRITSFCLLNYDLDPNFLKEVVQSYFFFREIKKIKFRDIFKLLKIGFSLKIMPLVIEIMNFLEKAFKNNKNPNKIPVILKESLLSSFPDTGKNLIGHWIIKSGKHLIEKKLSDKFFGVFDKEFFKKSSSIEMIFDFLLKNVIKESNVPNDFIMKFITIFGDSLIKAQMARILYLGKIFFSIRYLNRI